MEEQREEAERERGEIENKENLPDKKRGVSWNFLYKEGVGLWLWGWKAK